MPLPTTKAQWVAKLQLEEVSVPSEWTLLQINAEIMESQKQQSNPIMLEELADVRGSARKKADPQSFLKDQGIIYGQNDTNTIMTAKAERAICQKLALASMETCRWTRCWHSFRAR